ncbi:ribosomal protein RPL35 [Besnoitia besnoiti]|uniref:Ribosomal protein RPL35 n=1 Tax=Besnoitia besnoiti TaxID=94643 RepID=A0A2A9M7Z3_BESBE|nr:ribosomal protein RPL35 [Besnoitia besnoiti]PFH31492.1 ribosomal protein RPL35 [Besnoitia besnoiti]
MLQPAYLFIDCSQRSRAHARVDGPANMVDRRLDLRIPPGSAYVQARICGSLSASPASPSLCSTMVKVRAYELRGKSQKELVKQLEDLKKELAQLRVAKVTGGAASKLSKVTEVRKGIARVLTVYTQKQKEEARAAFKGKKFLPNDLRKKKTRAIRRRMTVSQTRKMTVRKMKRTQNVPKRKFALIA